jgi:flagellar P-ring protein precursor FlgI
MRHSLTIIAACVLAAASSARAERVKDIVDIAGVRGNPLIGIGLVVGLNGTGDGSEVSRRELANMLRRSNLVVQPADLTSDSVASVAVTAELGPFSRRGTTLDVTVSVLGSASSLQGGTLLMSELRGADGEVYAVAQGSIAIGGFAATGQAGSISKNHTTVGRIPNGATVEREELATFVECGRIGLQLKNADFATAQNMVETINALYPRSAVAQDAGNVAVQIPPDVTPATLAKFVDAIGALEVRVDQPAVIVINERTGTIVVGENVGISTVAISHGNLSIVTEETPEVSQPMPYSRRGTTETVPRTSINTIEEKRPLSVVPRQVSVSELARALNAMGLSPRDLISIFQALKQAGALQAELRII